MSLSLPSAMNCSARVSGSNISILKIHTGAHFLMQKENGESLAPSQYYQLQGQSLSFVFIYDREAWRDSKYDINKMHDANFTILV